jgi:protein gp37
MQKTQIEWADYTWNPISGCSPASEGCNNCYAARIANRFKGTPAFPDGFKVTPHPERLDEPRKLKGKGKRIFVCSMSDIFHPDVPDGFIEQIFKVMRETPQHAFFVLTKRPERMVGKNWAVDFERHTPDRPYVSNWYAPNIWVGVSVENQAAADKRIPVLIDLFIAHRFVSVEPMLGPVNLTIIPANCKGVDGADVPEDYFSALNGWTYDPQESQHGRRMFNHLDWVIAGAESGPGKRECRTEWACKLWHQCKVAKVPFFFKNYNDIRDANCAFDGEWPCPHDREWPKGVSNEAK